MGRVNYGTPSIRDLHIFLETVARREHCSSGGSAFRLALVGAS